MKKKQYRILKRTNYLEEVEYLPQVQNFFFGFIPYWSSLSIYTSGFDFYDKWLTSKEECYKHINYYIEAEKKIHYYRTEIIPYP